jgi:Ca-activated chloride channel family protein
MPLATGKLNDPLLAHWQTGLGKAAAFTSDAYNKWSSAWVGSQEYDKLWSQIVRGVARAPISADFETTTTLDGPRGKIVVEAYDKDASARNFLSMSGTVVGGADMKQRPVRLVQTGPGTYEADFDSQRPGELCRRAWHYHGPKGDNGMLIAAAWP